MKINFVPKLSAHADVVVFIQFEGAELSPTLKVLDQQSGGRITQAMQVAQFTGKRDQILELIAPSKDRARIIFIGAGQSEKLSLHDYELTGGLIAGHLLATKQKNAFVVSETFSGKHKPEEGAAIGSGLVLRNYHFNKYKGKKPDSAPLLEAVTIVTQAAAKAKAAYAPLEALAEGVHLARDLVNEPANVLYPEEFAKRVQALARSGLKIEVLKPTQMKKLGMGALLGVAQGSPFEPRLVVMRWNGAPQKNAAPLAFVGKGVTFDTGGVSIKPAAGMEDMKGDMGGAAAVTGLMLALAKRKAKVNAIGAIGLVENAIDGAAQRPGDIVKSMSGQTIAVLNTDAEGRLVLADVLWYVQAKYKPKFMVNLATLTGAIMVALGKEHAGLFSNNDELSSRLTAAGLETGEKVWRMPLSPEYDKGIDSDVADMKNIGNRFGGAITAAQFLQRFVNKLPWAHLDIAGTAMDATKSALNTSWGSGWGVRLLNQLVTKHYEK